MNKEQLIRELKYTKEKHKNDKVHTFDTDISVMCGDVLDVLSRCVEISDNATNGDIIKIIFPNMKVDISGGVVKSDRYTQFDLSWWNAPYK